MKIGDNIPVMLAGQVVAQATIKQVGEGEVTIVVPGTIVRMAVRTELAPEVTMEKPEPSTEHIIDGVDRANGDGTVTHVDAPSGDTPVTPLPEVTPPGSNEPAASAAAPVVNIESEVSPVVSDTPNVETTE